MTCYGGPMRIITLLALCASLSACYSVKRIVPHYAVRTHGGVNLDATAGLDYIAAQADGVGSLTVYVQGDEGGRYLEKWSIKLNPGEGWYRRVTWGMSGDGWIQLEPVSCEAVRVQYAWLTCPEPNPAAMRVQVTGNVERRQMFVGVEM